MTGNDGLLALIAVLNEIDAPYMLVGSYSSNQYGIPRSTQDADLVLQFEGALLKEIINRLPQGLTLDQQSTFEMVTATRKEVLLVDNSNFKIELFYLSSDSFDQVRFERRIRSQLDDNLYVFFPTPEDVVIQKMRWAKDGSRSKDFDDVVAVLKVQDSLDFIHIRHWCEIHGSIPLLEKALSAAE